MKNDDAQRRIEERLRGKLSRKKSAETTSPEPEGIEPSPPEAPAASAAAEPSTPAAPPEIPPVSASQPAASETAAPQEEASPPAAAAAPPSEPAPPAPEAEAPRGESADEPQASPEPATAAATKSPSTPSVIDREHVAQVARELEEASQFEQRLHQQRPRVPVTLLFIGLTLAGFILAVLSSPFGEMGYLLPEQFALKLAALLGLSTNAGPFTVSGQWWRVLTSTFLCRDVFVLGVGLWFLWSIGRQVERLFGSLAMAVIYIVAGAAGGLGGLIQQPLVAVIGPMDAVFGLYGAWFAAVWLGGRAVPSRIVRENGYGLLWLVLLTVLLYFLRRGVVTIPVGGLVVGALMGLALAPKLASGTALSAGLRAAPVVAAVALMALSALVATKRVDADLVNQTFAYAAIPQPLPSADDDEDPSAEPGKEKPERRVREFNILEAARHLFDLTRLIDRRGVTEQAIKRVNALAGNPDPSVAIKAALAQGMLEAPDEMARRAVLQMVVALQMFSVPPPEQEATTDEERQKNAEELRNRFVQTVQLLERSFEDVRKHNALAPAQRVLQSGRAVKDPAWQVKLAYADVRLTPSGDDAEEAHRKFASIITGLTGQNVNLFTQYVEAMRLAGPSSAAALLMLLDADYARPGSPLIRAQVIRALGEIGPQAPDEVRTAILQGLGRALQRSPSADVCLALARFGEHARPFVPALLELVDLQEQFDPFSQVNQQFAAALGEALVRIDGAEAVKGLLSRFGGENRSSWLAEDLLYRVGSPDEFSAWMANHPDEPKLLIFRANAHSRAENFAAARADLQQAVDLSGNDSDTVNRLAWLLATCKDDAVRDPQQAVALAQQALAGAKSDQRRAAVSDTLAAALAAAGDFAQAQKTAEQAIALARNSGQGLLAAVINARLEMYKKNQPFIEGVAPQQPEPEPSDASPSPAP